MNGAGGKVLIATRNRGKAAEFAAAFGRLGRSVVSLLDVEGAPETAEDGNTFLENAAKKAMEAAAFWRLPAVADDSGLCVDRLGGAPGVYSARYAGEGAGDEANNRKLLDELRRVHDSEGPSPVPPGTAPSGSFRLLSPARYVCALVYYDPSTGLRVDAEGECAGWIIDTPIGSGGFGYDPLFYLPEFGCTMAQLSMEDKNRISHRGRALEQLIAKLASLQIRT
jgi:Xanthosine triphosphate pyrophosphatase